MFLALHERVVEIGVHIGIRHPMDARLHQRGEIEPSLDEGAGACRGQELLWGQLFVHDLHHLHKMGHLRVHRAGPCERGGQLFAVGHLFGVRVAGAQIITVRLRLFGRPLRVDLHV